MSEETREHRPFAAEVKFLLTPAAGSTIRAWIRDRLSADPHGSGDAGDCYPITSLYCDTAAKDAFFRRGSYGRAKYRVRRYADSDTVFLERKLRTKNFLTKRRSVVPIDDLAKLDADRDTWPDHWHGAWFGRRLLARRLAPVCQVAYTRVARLASTPHGLARLTLDEHLRAWQTDGLEFQDGPAQQVLPDQVILELKYRVEMPTVFKALVEEFGLFPTPISKYRLSTVALGLATDPEAEAASCQAS